MRVEVNERLPISELLVLDGFIDEKLFRVLKDDRCITNVMSYEFFKKKKDLKIADSRI